MNKPCLEVAEVFREYAKTYRHTYGSSMSLEQRRVMRAIDLIGDALIKLGTPFLPCDFKADFSFTCP